MVIKDHIMVKWVNTMAKKRKLNSNNPKYKKEEKKVLYKKVFVKEIKGCKIYNCYEIL